MSLLIVTWLKACIKVNLRGAQGGQKDVSLCHSLFLALVFNFDWHERISVHIPLNIATSPPSHHPMPMSWIRTRWIRVCLQPKSIKSSCVSLWVLNGTQDWGGPNDHRVPGPPLFEDGQTQVPQPSATPTDIPAQARGREIISRVIWEEKIDRGLHFYSLDIHLMPLLPQPEDCLMLQLLPEFRQERCRAWKYGFRERATVEFMTTKAIHLLY